MKKKLPLEDFLMPCGYALETLINGNISHSIEYLNNLLGYGSAGLHRAIDELQMINDDCSEKYSYIKERVIMPDEQKFYRRNKQKAFNK